LFIIVTMSELVSPSAEAENGKKKMKYTICSCVHACV